MVAVGIALARLEPRPDVEDDGRAPPLTGGRLAGRLRRTLGGLAVRLLPEFVAVAFVLGAFRAELFPPARRRAAPSCSSSPWPSPGSAAPARSGSRSR